MTGGEPSAPGAVTPSAPARADLTPVPAPDELFLVGRLANPAKVVDTIAAWSKLPIDWRQMLAKEEPGLERVVYLDAPVELAVALDPAGTGTLPQPLAVVSVGLTSLESAVELARQKGEPVRQIRPGVFRVGGGGDSCAIAAALGKAPARLVCGDRPEDVDALLPYATRGLPNEQLGAADFHLELRAEPVRRRHSRELRQLKLFAPFAVRDFSLDNARFDRALKDAAHGIAEELIAVAEDLDQLTVDAWVKGDSIESNWSLRLRNTQSWTGQTLAQAGKRSKPPPETFWKLPADADSASFAVGMDPKRYQAIRRTLAELLDGWLEHERVPRRVRDDMVELVEQAFKTEGATAYARGTLPPLDSDPQGSVARARELARSGLGWHVLAIDDKPDTYKKHLGNLVRSYNDPLLRKTLQKRLHVDPKELPKLSTRPARGLPAGSVAYELSIPADAIGGGWSEPTPKGKKPPPEKPISFVLVVVPQGQTTWLGLSADEQVLRDRLAVAMKGAADTTLASRTGLGPLKTTPAVSGGFFSLAGLMGSLQSSLMGIRGGAPARLFAGMPHQGQTPVWHQATVKAAGKGLVMDWKVSVPRAVVEDIAAAVPAVAMGAAGVGAAPPPPPPPQPRSRR